MLMLSLTIVYKLQYKKNIPMNDKTIIELFVSQNIMICQYFAVQLFVSFLERQIVWGALNNC